MALIAIAALVKASGVPRHEDVDSEFVFVHNCMTGLGLRRVCCLVMEIGLRPSRFSLTQVLMAGRSGQPLG
jgi:hypothetical protein